MDTVFASPGMIATAAFVFVVQGVSLLLLIVNVHVSRKQKAKYEYFLRTLGDEASLGNPGRFLIPTYIAVTLIATAVILYLFIFQPHLL